MTDMNNKPLDFVRDGAERIPRAAVPALDAITERLAALPFKRAGLRLNGLEGLAELLSTAGTIGRRASEILGPHAKPVRAVLFDKSAAANWGLGWHQDCVVVVRHRLGAPGFTGWSVKDGMVHANPPWEVATGMVTLRIHLDAVPASNAPLLVARGSHRLGRIPGDEIDAVAERCGVSICLAEAGDIWRYATPIAHASARAERPVRRRVLHVDYAARALPCGLEWAGV